MQTNPSISEAAYHAAASAPGVDTLLALTDKHLSAIRTYKARTVRWKAARAALVRESEQLREAAATEKATRAELDACIRGMA